MPVGDLIAADYQIELGGLLLGAGTPYELAEAPDGVGMPDNIREDDDPIPLAHGINFHGPDLMGGRKRAWKVWVLGSTPVDTMAKVDALVGAWAPAAQTQTLVWRLPGTTRLEYGRPRKCEVDLGLLPQATAKVSLQWMSSDPRQYDPAVSTAATAPLFTAGGRTYPKTYSLTYGGASAGSGTVVCTNAGNVNTYPTLRVVGATGAPIRLQNVTTNMTFDLQLLLNAGESVTVDMAARTIVRENGVALFVPTAQWWPLAPGDNAVQFVAGGLSSSLLTITWQSAWI